MAEKKKRTKKKVLKDQTREPEDLVVDKAEEEKAEPKKGEKLKDLDLEEVKPGRLETMDGRFAIVTISSGYAVYDNGDVVDIVRYHSEKSRAAAKKIVLDILNKG